MLGLPKSLSRKRPQNFNCRAKESGDSGPFDIKPKAHAEEEEVLEDE